MKRGKHGIDRRPLSAANSKSRKRLTHRVRVGTAVGLDPEFNLATRLGSRATLYRLLRPAATSQRTGRGWRPRPAWMGDSIQRVPARLDPIVSLRYILQRARIGLKFSHSNSLKFGSSPNCAATDQSICEPGVDRRPRPASMEAPIQGVNMPPIPSSLCCIQQRARIGLRFNFSRISSSR